MKKKEKEEEEQEEMERKETKKKLAPGKRGDLVNLAPSYLLIGDCIL